MPQDEWPEFVGYTGDEILPSLRMIEVREGARIAVEGLISASHQLATSMETLACAFERLSDQLVLGDDLISDEQHIAAREKQ